LLVERIEVRGLGRPLSDYSSVVAVQGAKLLFVSGKVPVDEDGNTVGVGDVETQCRQAMLNLQAALQAAGAGLEDVVKLTAVLSDRRHFPVWRRIRQEFFSKDFPASTGFAVGGLGDEQWVIEVEAIAAVPEDSAK
jgi:enamine deaminase RidA (YjgF/YER057c/UK114 family)